MRRSSFGLRGPGLQFPLDEVLEETGADRALVKELEDYGVIKAEHVNGELVYDDTEREIVRAVTELKRFGVGGRNLRVFRTSADREAACWSRSWPRRCAPATRSDGRRRSRRSRTWPRSPRTSSICC